jgi:hypothetical protein
LPIWVPLISDGSGSAAGTDSSGAAIATPPHVSVHSPAGARMTITAVLSTALTSCCPARNFTAIPLHSLT